MSSGSPFRSFGDKLPEEHDRSIFFSTEGGTITQHVVTSGSALSKDVMQIKSDIPLNFTISQSDEFIKIRRQKRESIYYSVTEEEINSYAQFGWLANFCLVFLGLMGGFALGCVLALVQGNLPDTTWTTFFWLAILAALFFLFLLVLSIVLLFMQRRQKKAWILEAEV